MGEWEFESELWAWRPDEPGGWVFLTVPADVGEEIRLTSGPPRGFGSVRVVASVGATSWRTSVFPDRARGYVLPVKQAVRRAADVDVGDAVVVRLALG